MLEERKAVLIMYGSTSDSPMVGTVLGWCWERAREREKAQLTLQRNAGAY